LDNVQSEFKSHSSVFFPNLNQFFFSALNEISTPLNKYILLNPCMHVSIQNETSRRPGGLKMCTHPGSNGKKVVKPNIWLPRVQGEKNLDYHGCFPRLFGSAFFFIRNGRNRTENKLTPRRTKLSPYPR
jgi:hypothetical protein